MKRMKMHSRDNVAANVEAVGRLFPHALTEVIRDGKVVQVIDFDVLRQELSREIVEGREERYAFTWPDKRQMRRSMRRCAPSWRTVSGGMAKRAHSTAKTSTSRGTISMY